MLSGLIERVSPADSSLPPDEVAYEFVADARDLLTGTLSLEETESLEAVMKPVQERIRSFVEGHSTNASSSSFRALISDPLGTEKLPAEARTFIEVSRRIYEKKGLIPPPSPPPVEKRSEKESDTSAESSSGGQTAPEAIADVLPDAIWPGAVWPAQSPLASVSILWVDDVPENNRSEVEVFRTLGAQIKQVKSTRGGPRCA